MFLHRLCSLFLLRFQRRAIHPYLLPLLERPSILVPPLILRWLYRNHLALLVVKPREIMVVNLIFHTIKRHRMRALNLRDCIIHIVGALVRRELIDKANRIRGEFNLRFGMFGLQFPASFCCRIMFLDGVIDVLRRPDPIRLLSFPNRSFQISEA